MHPFDIAVLIIVGLFAVLGLRRGFVRGALDLVGWAGALVVAGRWSYLLRDALAGTALAPVAAPAAFTAVAIGALVVWAIVLGIVAARLPRLPFPPLRFLDRLLGVLPGLVKGVIAATVVLLPIVLFQQQLGLTDQLAGARLTGLLVAIGSRSIEVAATRAGFDPSGFITVIEPGPPGVELPFRITEGLTVDADAERRVVELVNAARREAGLQPVGIDAALAAVGRAQAEAMFRSAFFAHDSPTTGSPTDRLLAAGIPFLLAGENLALAATVDEAHARLMESPGHRANILNPAFTRLGVGVVRSERTGLIVVQEFAA